MESLHYLLMKTHAMFSHKILTQASKIGLTSGQPKVLEFLLTHHEADQKKQSRHTVKSSRRLLAVSCCAWKNQG